MIPMLTNEGYASLKDEAAKHIVTKFADGFDDKGPYIERVKGFGSPATYKQRFPDFTQHEDGLQVGDKGELSVNVFVSIWKCVSRSPADSDYYELVGFEAALEQAKNTVQEREVGTYPGNDVWPDAWLDEMGVKFEVFNTYNDDNDLDGVWQGYRFEYGGVRLLGVCLHAGLDVRGGYSGPAWFIDRIEDCAPGSMGIVEGSVELGDGEYEQFERAYAITEGEGHTFRDGEWYTKDGKIINIHAH